MSSVFRYDRILIAPGQAELAEALAGASQAANKGCRARNLALGTAEARRLARKVVNEPEGFRQWNGTDGGTKRTSGNVTCTAVAVAWWTDALGRPHYRIAGERVTCSLSEAEHLLCPYTRRPPLWMVHPENVYFRDSEDSPPYVVCRCGMAGSVGALGWMGSRCAACHDRSEEGTTPPVPSGEPATTVLVGPGSWVGQVLFTPDGRAVLAGERCGRSVWRWDLASGAGLPLLTCTGHVSSLALAPDGQTLAVAHGPASLSFLSLDDNSEADVTIPGPAGTSGILALAYSPDGALLALAPYGRVELWDVASRTRRAIVATGLTAHNPDRYLAFAPDGRTLAIGPGNERGVQLWDGKREQGHNLDVPGVAGGADAVAFSPDGRLLALIADSPGDVFVVEVATGRVRFQTDCDRARCVSFSPDGRLLAVGTDEALRLYGVPDGKPLGVYLWHMQNLNDVAFSPDGQWLATSSDDGFVKLWPVAALVGGF